MQTRRCICFGIFHVSLVCKLRWMQNELKKNHVIKDVQILRLNVTTSPEQPWLADVPSSTHCSSVWRGLNSLRIRHRGGALQDYYDIGTVQCPCYFQRCLHWPQVGKKGQDGIEWVFLWVFEKLGWSSLTTQKFWLSLWGRMSGKWPPSGKAPVKFGEP